MFALEQRQRWKEKPGRKSGSVASLLSAFAAKVHNPNRKGYRNWKKAVTRRGNYGAGPGLLTVDASRSTVNDSSIKPLIDLEAISADAGQAGYESLLLLQVRAITASRR